MNRASTVDEYLEKSPEWRDGLTLLREVLNATTLKEEVKWGGPCYTIQGKNVVGMAAFKSYLGLWFHQGVFLSDPGKKLINAGEGKTKGLRQWRFSSTDEVKNNIEMIAQYVAEAIANQEAGKEIKVERKRHSPFPKSCNTISIPIPASKPLLKGLHQASKENLPSISEQPAKPKPKPHGSKKSFP